MAPVHWNDREKKVKRRASGVEHDFESRRKEDKKKNREFRDAREKKVTHESDPYS